MLERWRSHGLRHDRDAPKQLSSNEEFLLVTDLKKLNVFKNLGYMNSEHV